MTASFENYAGSNYFLCAEAIHRVKILKRPCITSLDTEEKNNRIHVYGGHEEEQEFTRRMVSEREKDEIVRLLMCISSDLI